MDKQHILDEIRRTAAANDGIPLGIDRLRKETGIRHADWHGKYWVRWSDAVREAGFEPNGMVQAYDEAVLLEKYAALIRELKRVPVKGDLLMKARNDRTFPNEKTFSRFGSKSQLLAKLVNACRVRGNSQDVIDICAGFVPAKNLPVKGVEPKLAVDALGFVYLIKSGKRYKIGRSSAFERRERELAMQLAEKPSTVHTIRTDDPSGIEAYWHRRFAEKRKYGEWFELSSADVKAFKLRKFM
jgi:hypothetical protein